MNIYLQDFGTAEAGSKMDLATAEAVFDAEIKRIDQSFHISKISNMLDEVGHENIPVPALNVIMDTVSKEALKEEVEQGTSESLLLGKIAMKLGDKLLKAISTKIYAFKANERIGELSTILETFDAKKVDKNEIESALDKRVGLTTFIGNKFTSSDLTVGFTHVQDALNAIVSEARADMKVSDLFKSIDSILFKNAKTVSGHGKSLILYYNHDEIGVAAIDDLKLYIVDNGKPNMSMLSDIVKDAKDNLTKKAIDSTLDNYSSAMSNVDKTIRSLKTKMQKIQKERGDSFMKRSLGNGEEWNAFERREQIMYELVYKNFIGSYASYVKDVHGLLKDLSK